MVEMDPMMQWTVGIMAGGTTATAVKAGGATLRAASSMSTGGLGNPVVSTGELIMSVVFSVLSFVIPMIAGVLVLMLMFFLARAIYRRRLVQNRA